jgi:hypothetical protein
MLIEEIITEATDVLFHFTHVGPALEIINSGNFQLTQVHGSVEQQYAPAGYDYFLSTTRSKVGGYHHYVGSSAVMFVLDGRRLAHHHPVKPVDYWAGFSHRDRHSESEDRVWSRTPEMSADCITQVHILLTEPGEFTSPRTRQLLIAAKTRHIPAYVYDDADAWRLQNTRKAVPISQITDRLKGAGPRGYTRMPGTRWLLPWLEMIYQNRREGLSRKASERMRSLLWWNGTDDMGLGTELSNARKPGNSDYADAVKIIQFMKANKLNSVKELIKFLHDKWDAIYS